MEKLVVTRYKTLVEYLINIGLIDSNVNVITHAKIEDVRGKHVIGVLPYWLACHSGKFTEVPLRMPSEKRGKELTLEEIEFYSFTPKTYTIRETRFEDDK